MMDNDIAALVERWWASLTLEHKAVMRTLAETGQLGTVIDGIVDAVKECMIPDAGPSS